MAEQETPILVRDSFYRILASLGQLVTSIGLGWLSVRLLGAVGKGELYLVIQLGSMGSLLLGLGLGPAYQYHFTRGSLDRAGILAHMLTQLALVGVLMTLVWAFGQPLLRLVAGHGLSPGMLGLTSLAVFLNVCLLFLSCLLNAQSGGLRQTSLLALVGSAVNLALLYPIVHTLRMGAPGAVIAYLAGILVQCLPAAWKVFSDTRPGPPGAYPRLSPALFRYGGASLLGNLMLSSVFRMDVFLVNALAGTRPLGIYSISVALAELVLMFPNALGSVLFAHMPRLEPDQQTKVLEKTTRVTLCLAVVMGLGLILLGRPMVLLLAGKDFLGAVGPLYALIPGLVLMSVTYIFSNYFAARGEPMLSAVIFFGGLVVNVVSNLILIPRWGILGAGVASSLAYSVIFLLFLCTLLARKTTALGRLLVPRREDVLPMLGSLWGRYAGRAQRSPRISR